MTRIPGLRPDAAPPGPLVLAVSGGLDSMVLLHWYRFHSGRAHDLHVAHFDHGMRSSSSADARWLAGVCRAWELPLHGERASEVPASEARARELRYAFLRQVRSRVGGSAVVTAHHADDQAETVLFRALRGAGLRGLRAMEHARGDLVRPLLSVWRDELTGYAESAGLAWRDDPTNRDLGLARNALRHRILPDAERWVAPGARASLVRLAGNAVRAYEELAAADALLIEPRLRPRQGGGGEAAFVVRDGDFRELPPPLRRRLARAVAHRLGVTLGQEATDRVCAAMETLDRGRVVELAGGARGRHVEGAWIFERTEVAPAGSPDRDAEHSGRTTSEG